VKSAAMADDDGGMRVLVGGLGIRSCANHTATGGGK
jgi:hypothetical protein